jgi:hypothetical protein
MIDEPNEHDALNVDSVPAWAYRYAQRGWSVLAVWGVNGDLTCECGDPHDGTRHPDLDEKNIGKHPVANRSWTDGTTDLAVIEAWFPPDTRHNIAIVPGLSNLLVIDIDGPIGEDEAKRFHLPDTLEARSGHGRHLYYAADDVETIPSTDLGKNINTRAATGYIIATPSRHWSGGFYGWVNW